MTAGDVWDKLWGIAVGGGIRWIELLADVSSAFVKCFSAQNFYEPFPWTFTGNWTSIIFLHILYSISSLGETQQFCGDYIFSGHTGCLILAYLVVSHNLHDILDLKRGNWS